MNKQCCDDFERALQSGTDNEAYSSAVWSIDDKDFIGCVLGPIKFCPWCGKKLKRKKDKE